MVSPYTTPPSPLPPPSSSSSLSSSSESSDKDEGVEIVAGNQENRPASSSPATIETTNNQHTDADASSSPSPLSTTLERRPVPSVSSARSHSHSVALTQSVASHALWGIGPVCSRYLQTRPTPVPLDGIQLLAAGQIAALFLTAVAGRIAELAVPPRSRSAARPSPLPSPPRSPSPQPPRASSRAAALRYLIPFGIVATCRSATNILSTRYALAYDIQLVACLGPLVTTLLSNRLIGEAVPWTLWLTLAAASVGEALVVLGQRSGDSHEGGGGGGVDSGGAGDDDDPERHRDDAPTHHPRTALGLGLQLVSLLFSGLARVVMKSSGDDPEVDLPPSSLLASQYVSVGLLGLAYVALVSPSVDPLGRDYQEEGDGDGWRRRHHWARIAAGGGWTLLTPGDWAVFAVLSAGVFAAAATLQVRAIRYLGPGGHSALQPLRLFATVAGSYALLHEGVGTPVEWAGMAVVLASLGWYVAVGRAAGLRVPPPSSAVHRAAARCRASLRGMMVRGGGDGRGGGGRGIFGTKGRWVEGDGVEVGTADAGFGYESVPSIDMDEAGVHRKEVPFRTGLS